MLTKVQQAWLANDVPQCGYCQAGMIMAVTALLKDKPKPTDADINDAITNICRCGTFQQVRAAIHAAATRNEGGHNMNYVRRSTAVLSSSAPLPPARAHPWHEAAVRFRPWQQGTPELNAWVVVRPDDTVVVRFGAPRWARAR